MSDPEIITIAEAASLLRISERTAYDLARDGKLAGAIKIGSQWRIDRGVLITWLKAEAVVPERTKGAA